MDFNSEIATVLAEYHQRIAAENTLMKSLPGQEMIKRRDEFLLPVGKEAGQFLFSLAKASAAKTILEIGTSYGYSTLWLAAAAQANNAQVITLELDKQKAAYAKSQIDKAGLGAFVEFRIGDALESIRAASERFDFVLLDIWKALYIPCFELVYPKLNQGAFLIADNIIHPPSYQNEMAEYRKNVTKTNAFDSVLLPLGSGLEVSCMR